MRASCSALAAAAALLLVPGLAPATNYEVGPGKALANLNDVPWESLGPGDLVLVSWRSTPYKEKFVLCRQGTQSQPIVVRGVLGPGGERPIIDGNGATTRSALNFWGEDRGVVKIGGANTPADTMPKWIVLENLDVTSGRQPYTFTGRNGVTPYAKNSAAIYVEKGENVTIRNCVIRDSGNGLFATALTKELLVEGNDLRDNGNDGSVYEHNNYTAAVGITFQYNRFRPLRANCSGNNLKDRSVGTVVRYNWIEGGNRALDLVDAEDDPSLTTDPRYRTTYVYGNVLLKPDGGNNQVLHYGGDSGNTALYRKGTLHFFNNTVVSTRSGNTTLLRLSTNEEKADVRNNVIFVTAAGATLAWVDSSGLVDLWNNWTKPGPVDSHSGLTGTVTDHGGGVTGAAPGFVDAASQDFHLAAGAACLDKGAALAAAVPAEHALLLQYRPHQGAETRPVDGPLDLGAFERCGGACAGADAGTPADAASTSTDAGTIRPDAASPRVDAATLAGADAAAAAQDAGAPAGADAQVGWDGASAADGSAPPADADAAQQPPVASSGCGCSTSASPSFAIAGLAWALLRSRRRARV